jgi:hypothetical protein
MALLGFFAEAIERHVIAGSAVHGDDTPAKKPKPDD